MTGLWLSRLILCLYVVVLGVCAGLLAYYVFWGVLYSFVPLFPPGWKRPVFEILRWLSIGFGLLAGLTIARRAWNHRGR